MRTSTPRPHQLDVLVGARLRLLRKALGLNQRELGETVGLSQQQIQKYESGTNRIGASKLYGLSRVLGVPISFFFSETGLTRAQEFANDNLKSDVLREPETSQLVSAYFDIRSPALRDCLLRLANSLAAMRRTIH